MLTSDILVTNEDEVGQTSETLRLSLRMIFSFVRKSRKPRTFSEACCHSERSEESNTAAEHEAFTTSTTDRRLCLQR